MGTSVHIPKPLLAAVDRKAKTLQLSRNKLIIRALEREVTQGSDWSPDFFDRLQADNDVAAAADEALAIIKAARRSKKPPKL